MIENSSCFLHSESSWIRSSWRGDRRIVKMRDDRQEKRREGGGGVGACFLNDCDQSNIFVDIGTGPGHIVVSVFLSVCWSWVSQSEWVLFPCQQLWQFCLLWGAAGRLVPDAVGGKFKTRNPGEGLSSLIAAPVVFFSDTNSGSALPCFYFLVDLCTPMHWKYI